MKILYNEVDYSKLYFTTATIQGWYPLLIENEYKDIIVNSFKFLVEDRRARIYAFVIMDNHIHVIWELLEIKKIVKLRQPFLKYIAQQIKFRLQDSNDIILEVFRVDKRDRTYQFWKYNPKDILIQGPKILKQKIEYIHNNLLKKGESDEAYLYSSCASYVNQISNWEFLTIVQW